MKHNPQKVTSFCDKHNIRTASHTCCIYGRVDVKQQQPNNCRLLILKELKIYQ